MHRWHSAVLGGWIRSAMADSADDPLAARARGVLSSVLTNMGPSLGLGRCKWAANTTRFEDGNRSIKQRYPLVA